MLVAGCTAAPAKAEVKPTSRGATPARPNIVFVLTDDLAWNLVRYMPQVQKLQHDGVTFTDYTVTDSLCCPSRSSIFTGRYPHDTGIFTNNPPDGGFALFHRRGEESATYATALQAAGYRTAMMGKYLNGYLPTYQVDGKPFVPPGWSEWDVGGNAYNEFNYRLNENHKVVKYGSAPRDYLTDVLSAKATAFIRDSAAAHTPFVLEVATYAPHSPQVPAPRDAQDFPGLRAPRTAAYGKLPSGAPKWLARHAPLTPAQDALIDTQFRMRAQAVQAVDRMIGSIRETLAATGVTGDTYLVFSSDNGYHMGEYRLLPGKQTAFDTDILVPLIIVGPGVAGGVSRAEVVQNVDLTPTFEQLAGAPAGAGVEGRSLVPLLGGQPTSGWRTAALIEHHGPASAPGDPDAQIPANGLPTTYEAMRTATFTYVEYTTGEREYYARDIDPQELHNIAGQLPAARLAALHDALERLRDCHTAAQCWEAGHVSM